MNKDWRESYIKYSGRDEDGIKHYVAYREDYTELGTYETWDEAAQAITEYAKTI